MDELKKVHPQKYYVKKICNFMFYVGLGNCWYEAKNHSKLQKKLYFIWASISNGFIFFFLIDEYLSYLRSDLDYKERNDLVMFLVGHSMVAAKIIFTFLQKKRIIMVLEKLLEGSRSMFVSTEVDEACVKQFVRLSLVVAGIAYATLFTATVDSIRIHLVDGLPIHTEVMFYPTILDTSVLASILRFLSQLHWWFIATIMAAIDCLCISALVIVGHKFKAVQVYFTSLREKILNGVGEKSRRVLLDEYKIDFVTGIKLHEDALWCAKNVQYALGNLYSVQIFEGYVILVICLIKLVTLERSLSFLLANFTVMALMIVLTGAYMLAAGDITHEASLVSTAIFHSGWELVSSGRELRALAVLAIQRSQVPVYMFAFGILILSYNNFITVIRSSYSFFAVMY